MSGQWVTINEAAAHWHVHRCTIHGWIKKGRIQTKLSPSGTKRVLLKDPVDERADMVRQIMSSTRKVKR